MPPSDDTPPPSSSSDAQPDIDTLLKNSRWEDRVAEARIKREKVLAAKAAAKAKPQQILPPRRVRPASNNRQAQHSPPPVRRGKPGRIRKALLVLVVALLSVGLGAYVASL